MNGLTFCSLATLFVFSELQVYGQDDKLPNDARWVRESNEYANLCRQTFRMAQDTVRDQIKNSSGQKIAVVMDLDETVLDNSLYQVEPSSRIGVHSRFVVRLGQEGRSGVGSRGQIIHRLSTQTACPAYFPE